jgi:hypothetical protein
MTKKSIVFLAKWTIYRHRASSTLHGYLADWCVGSVEGVRMLDRVSRFRRWGNVPHRRRWLRALSPGNIASRSVRKSSIGMFARSGLADRFRNKADRFSE